MPFTTLYVEQIDRRNWKLIEDLTYEEEGHDDLTVPADTVTDFASVPRPFWWLVPRSGRHTRAAVLHDWLCERRDVSRWEADETFRRALHDVRVPFLLRWLIWAGVRAGSALQRRGGLFNVRECGVGQLLLVLIIAVLALPILVLALVVQLFLLFFWLAT